MMNKWSIKQAKEWYKQQPWIVGCNFLPSSAINQLEMWQNDTYDPATIKRELDWTQSLGFNALRVYLHDLVWAEDRSGFIERIDHFLEIARHREMKVLLVLFDDCHRPDPEAGKQPLPVYGIHNSGWKQSPGRQLVSQFHEGTVSETEKNRLAEYVKGVLTHFKADERILMWDVYNEPGRSENKDRSLELLEMTWQWAQEVRPSQPLTSCLDGADGRKNIELNGRRSDIITFHCYSGTDLEPTIIQHLDEFSGRPLVCTEYMAREFGTTFQHSLPIFRKYRTGCFNWGLVAGKSQTHFNWESVENLEKFKEQGRFLRPGDPIPEPSRWFHDIFRVDGTPFSQMEIDFIRKTVKNQAEK